MIFDKIKQFFSGEKQQELESLMSMSSGDTVPRELYLAATVLLVDIASGDGAIDSSEGLVVTRTIAEQFDMAMEKIPQLVQDAVAARKSKEGKLDSFLESINQEFTESQRCRLLAMIWKVILADGNIEKGEVRLALQLRNRLRLSEEQGNHARELAEKNLL
jgi:uncharacterized tellurite resistance protein B-like protein